MTGERSISDMIRNMPLADIDPSLSAFDDPARKEIAIVLLARARALKAMMEEPRELTAVQAMQTYDSYYVLAKSAIEAGQYTREHDEADLAKALGFPAVQTRAFLVPN